MNKKEEIEKIANQERKILLTKTYIWLSLLCICIFSFWVFAKEVMETAASPVEDLESDQKAIIKIIITFSFFAVALIISYFFNKKLSKKLDKLWEQKKALF